MSYYPKLERWFKGHKPEDIMKEPIFGDITEMPTCEFCEKEKSILKIYIQYWGKFICKTCLNRRQQCVNCPTLTNNTEKKSEDLWDVVAIRISIHKQSKNFCLLYPASKCDFKTKQGKTKCNPNKTFLNGFIQNAKKDRAKNMCKHFEKGYCNTKEPCSAQEPTLTNKPLKKTSNTQTYTTKDNGKKEIISFNPLA